MQVFKTADGDDPDSDFEDPEVTSPSSPITYQVIFDNDTAISVTVSSLVDNKYPGAICEVSPSQSVVGQTLAADDGDGAGPPDGGPDEITCTFVETAPSTYNTTVIDIVTVQFHGSGTGQASDSATVKTAPPPVGGIVDMLSVRGASDSSPPPESATESPSSGRYLLLGATAVVGALMAAAAVQRARRRRWLG